MRNAVVTVGVVLALGLAAPASAQVESFVAGALHGGVYREHFGGASGGVLWTTKFLSVGAQGDAFGSPPYVAGRFTALAQGNLFDIRGVRPFVQLGQGWGVFEGTMLGAGIDVRPGEGRVGIRAAYQTYITKLGTGELRPQPTLSLGVIWRRP